MEVQHQTPSTGRRTAIKLGAVAMSFALAGIVAGGVVATDAEARRGDGSASRTPHAASTPYVELTPHAEPTGTRGDGRRNGGSARRRH
jgi:hypothetical protein